MPPPPRLITRYCALPGCEKTWKTVETSRNHFHDDAHKKAALSLPKGSHARYLAEEMEAVKKGPQRGKQWPSAESQGETPTPVRRFEMSEVNLGSFEARGAERREVGNDIKESGVVVESEGFEF